MAQDIVNPPASADSGTQGSQDPTLVSGQNPASLFGIAISYKTGATGEPPAREASPDPANEPNQLNEGISGLGPDVTGNTGAPGTMGVQRGPGDAGTVTVTDPNYTAGKPGGGSGNQYISVDTVAGPGQQSYPPEHRIPGLATPQGTGAGAGRVRRGGFMNGQRG